MTSFNLEKNKGFTLLELLVVIAIIGILASVVIVYLGSSKSKADVAFVKSSVSEIKNYFHLYLSNNGSYGNYSSAQANCSTDGVHINTGFCYSTYYPANSGFNSHILGGPAQCWDPFYWNDTSVFIIAGKAMEHLNSPSMYCVISSDGQSYAIAFQGMKSGPASYCFDSKGNIKESTTRYDVPNATTTIPPINPVTATCQ